MTRAYTRREALKQAGCLIGCLVGSACALGASGCGQTATTSVDSVAASPEEVTVAGANVQHKVYTLSEGSTVGAGENVVVTCLGDSITFGEGVLDPSVGSWPAQLSMLLGSGYEVHNYGVRGAALIDDSPVPYRRFGLVEEAAAMEPDIVIVMFGTNDARVAWWDPDKFEESLVEVTEKLAAGEGVRIVLMAPPRPFESVFGDLYDGYDSNPIVRDHVRAIVWRVANTYGYDFVDIYELTREHPEWYWDGIHLNDQGYTAVAHEVYNKVFATDEGWTESSE